MVPIWSGTIQLIHESQKKDDDMKRITLPVIDLNTTDMNNQPTIIPFDQPLYWEGNRLILESTDQFIKVR